MVTISRDSLTSHSKPALAFLDFHQDAIEDKLSNILGKEAQLALTRADSSNHSFRFYLTTDNGPSIVLSQKLDPKSETASAPLAIDIL